VKRGSSRVDGGDDADKRDADVDSGLPENLTSHIERERGERREARATCNESAVLSISKALAVSIAGGEMQGKSRNYVTMNAIHPAGEASKFIYSRGPGTHTHTHAYTRARAHAHFATQKRRVGRKQSRAGESNESLAFDRNSREKREKRETALTIARRMQRSAIASLSFQTHPSTLRRFYHPGQQRCSRAGTELTEVARTGATRQEESTGFLGHLRSASYLATAASFRLRRARCATSENLYHPPDSTPRAVHERREPPASPESHFFFFDGSLRRDPHREWRILLLRGRGFNEQGTSKRSGISINVV